LSYPIGWKEISNRIKRRACRECEKKGGQDTNENREGSPSGESERG